MSYQGLWRAENSGPVSMSPVWPMCLSLLALKLANILDSWERCQFFLKAAFIEFREVASSIRMRGAKKISAMVLPAIVGIKSTTDRYGTPRYWNFRECL